MAIARLGNPTLDIHRYSARLDELGQEAMDVAGGSLEPERLAAAIDHVLFGRYGYRGNSEEYAEPANSYLDQVIDRFRPFGDAYGKVLEQLEDRVLAKRGAVEGEESLEQILELTRALVRLRRLAIAQRHVLTRLAQAEFDEIPADSQPFFRDVSEHFVEFHDDVEVHLDEARALFEAFHSLSSYRMNEVMRLLTVISTIVLPLTFVTGVYGMNFPNMPEFSVPHSYELAWGIMISLSLVQVIWFRRRGWL